MRPWLPYVAFALLLSAVTVAVTAAPGRYRTTGPMVLDNLDFARGLDGWLAVGGGVQLARGETPTLMLRAAPERVRYVARSFPPPRDGSPAMRVRVWVSARKLTAGPEPGQDAGVLIMGVDKRGRQMWWWPRTVARVGGDQPWREHALVVPLSPDIRTFWLLAYTAAASGTLWVRDIRIDAVAQRGVFTAADLLLVLAWAGCALWVAVAIVRAGWRSPLRLASLAMAGVIVGFGVAPQPLARDTLVSVFFGVQDFLQDRAEQAADWLQPEAPAAAHPPGGAASRRTDGAPENGAGSPGGGSAADGSRSSESAADGARAADTALPRPLPGARPQRSYWQPPFLRSDKNLHVLGFGAFALVTVLAWRQHRLAVAVCALATVSVALQALQALTVTREADLVDLAHDLLGIGLGWLAGWILLAALRQARGRALRGP